MTEASNQIQPVDYVPPKVWTSKNSYGGTFGNINQPVSGARFEKELPVGKHPLQLYSQGTPNGQKVTIMLEELLAAGHSGAEYDAWLIDIFKGDQFGSGFVGVNPNAKIPALVDRSRDPVTCVFESGSILVHLAERFGAFLPTEGQARTETFNWLMWQIGSAPFVGGGLGHFYAYAPVKIEYAIDRYAMETKRQLHVLDTHLATHEFIAGDQYTIADMAIWPWYPGSLYGVYNTHEFLAVQEYVHLLRWYRAIAARPAVARGRVVNRASGDPGMLRVVARLNADLGVKAGERVSMRGGWLARPADAARDAEGAFREGLAYLGTDADADRSPMVSMCARGPVEVDAWPKRVPLVCDAQRVANALAQEMFQAGREEGGV